MPDQYRPDQSDYLAHFTRDGDPFCKDNNPVATKVAGMSAFDRLVAMLEQKKILASEVPWVKRAAVCLSECPWSSLISHAENYSPYGIGFTKPHIFAAGGGPVYYVRADHWAKQKWEDHLKTFVSPFWPAYRPASLRSDAALRGKTIDYSHEREWRVPHDFRFTLDQVSFVVVNTYEDVARFPKALKDSIGRKKFLIMDVYREIEVLWPVHRLGGAT